MSVDISKYRQWVCEFHFPGQKPARFGTLFVAPGTRHKQIKNDMRSKIEEHLPSGFTIDWVLPGRMWCELEDNLKPSDLENVP